MSSFESIGLGSRNCLNSIAKISARRLAKFYYPDPDPSPEKQTRYGTVTIPNYANYALAAYAGCRLAVDAECCFICDCLVVCVNLGPKAVISRGEQNRYGWRRRTLLTARPIKFYGGLRLMKSTAAARGSKLYVFN